MVACLTLSSRNVYTAAHGKSFAEDFLFLALTAFYALTVYFYFRASLNSPGYLPLRWRPARREQLAALDFCKVCNGYKAPRAHHCRRCGACVQRLDHHCDVLGNCVGLRNHATFLCFLLCYGTATTLSVYSLSYVLVFIYDEPHFLHLFNFTETRTMRILQVTAIFLALVVSLVVLGLISCLLFVQFRNAALNQTVLERGQLGKLRRRHPNCVFVNPYDLGICNNLAQLPKLANMDGEHYPLRPGVDEHVLTKEAQRQRGKRKIRPHTHCDHTIKRLPLANERRLRERNDRARH